MKAFVDVVKAALIAVIFSAMTMTVHAGGAGEQTGSANSGPAGAAQLAAELNALNNGSAVMNGDTVTLTRGIHAQKDLTVGAGVTLDITGDGELGIHNATLTVNGTVNAPSNKIYVDDRGDKNTPVWITLNGNGTINLKSKGQLIHTNENRNLILDGVTLVGIADNDSPLVGVYNSSEFVMKSGAIMGNTFTGTDWPNGGGVQVSEGSTFTMTGGTITGNSVVNVNSTPGKSANGGGVYVGGGSAFTMEGGGISGNTARVGRNLNIDSGGTAKWGTGGAYTKGGVPQSGGGNIASTDDTLIAVPAR